MAEGRQEWREWCFGAAKKRLPVLKWLPKYSLQHLQLDFLAGLTVGLTVIPQALAYAAVAGLPVQYGLYSSFMGCFVYCLLGTSKDVTLGPTAIMSLLVSSYAFHDPTYAVLLAFLSGCIQLAMGLLHLGFLLDFISHPVIKGFTSAAAVTIGFGQVKTLLGLQNIPQEFVLQVYYTFCRIGETRIWDAMLGVFCLIFLVGLQQMKKGMPVIHPMETFPIRISRLIVWIAATARNALVVLFAGLVAYSFQVTGSQPFTLTGNTPQGLPPAQPPPFSKVTPNGTISFQEMTKAMGAGLAVVPLMGLLETMAIAKSFASQHNYQIDPNQELLAMGFTNLLGSFFSSYPVTGSFGRTALNAQTGVCTPAGGLVTGALVLLSLAYLTSLFYYIPKAALAAVIICAVAPMFDAKIFRTLWQVKRLDLLPLCVTFLLCFWEVQYGIIAGVLVSLILLLYPLARPQIKVLEHEALFIQPASGLYFPAIEFLRDTVHKQTLSEPRLRRVILDCTHVSSIDYTVVLGLSELLREFQHRRLPLAFVGLQAQVLKVLVAADLEGFYHFPSMKFAEKSLEEELCNASEGFFNDDSESILPTSGIIQ
ncbi:sodium-independent sulfate anion transporter isoform X1 [Anolis carolinensis]|uniref:sodium-independent sulfate anion transporter isoform X1 n=2 Tax=Anolis carolinensis TaxID=28377 RepID=UPI000462A721|nr:PREDICTED: sodium-independent sulfate anion transporter [Anolis carolinensis]|eukprot:XP_008102366.1 PREDICTED: sodium-independent sulfate anion transporter [Anolis carolinensis]